MCASAVSSPERVPATIEAKPSGKAAGNGPAERVDEILARLHELAPSDPDRDRLREQAICACLPLARRIALRFGNRGEEVDDLAQVAMLALVKAVDRYDCGKGEFLHYAVPTIVGEIKRHFRDCGWAMRVHRTLQERHLAVLRVIPELSQAMQATPTPADVAAHLGVDQSEVLDAIGCSSAYTTRSLNATVGDSDARCELAELIGEWDHDLERVPDLLALHHAVGALTERQRELLRLRFLEGMTQSEIGRKVGVSQMHVSRLLTQALGVLREQMAA